MHFSGVLVHFIWHPFPILITVLKWFCYQAPSGQDGQGDQIDSHNQLSHQVKTGLGLSMTHMGGPSGAIYVLLQVLHHTGRSNQHSWHCHIVKFSGTRSLVYTHSYLYTLKQMSLTLGTIKVWLADRHIQVFNHKSYEGVGTSIVTGWFKATSAPYKRTWESIVR